jgi:hypothetical protein
MKILQHYYTSFINQETGSAGFQVKAMSLGIGPETQTMISRLISYRIPNSLDERATQTHPTALRYYPFNERESLLICSQSSGSDPNGRPGNFFAHTLVTDPQIFTTIPPILYWKSEFWRIEDDETCTELETLSDLPGDPALDIKQMWQFLQQDDHLEAFCKLMCAVVHGKSGRHRIIIVDTDEHVALWIAAVSCMLPPAYRPLLSFTTYHHDPHQSQFFITGIPPSPNLYLTPEDYVSYFILNMHEKQFSAVDDSLYATLVRQFVTPELYDNEMLTFFSNYAHRFPAPTAIDEQLNLIALYAHIMSQEGSITLTPNKLQAIRLALTTFEQLKYYESQDISDLRHLSNLLWYTYEISSDVGVQQIHQRIVKLLKLHEVPTDEIFKQQLTHYTSRIFKEYVPNTLTDTLAGIEQLLQDYGEAKFIDQVNQPTYLHTLSKLTMQAQPHHLICMWKYIGPYLLPSSANCPIFTQSLHVWGTLKKSTREPKLVQELFSALQRAIEKREQAWLGLLVVNHSRQTLPIEPLYLGLFYCTLVLPLSLEQREPYRNIIFPVLADLVDVEFTYELANTDLPMTLPAIGKWIAYIQRTGLCEPAALVARGLQSLYKQCNSKQWKMVARQALIDPQLSPFLDQWEARLLKDALSQISLSQFKLEHIPLYQRYHQCPTLSGRSRIIINAMLAMHNRHLSPQLTEELYDYISSLPCESYQTELTSFCNEFFTEQLSDDDHLQMLSAFFVWKYEDIFWLIYWEKLCVQPSEVMARLFAFWFTLLPMRLPHMYVTQSFLLLLRQNLQYYQKIPDFQKALNKQADSPWYAAIQESVLVRKSALLTMGQDLMKQVQKRLSNQKGEDETEEQKRRLSVEISKLFEKGRIREMHLSILMRTYQRHSPEQFWEVYKERLIQLLLGHNAEHVLELLSFWFDESFNVFGFKPYIAQCFFIGLPQVFDLARKENEADLRKTSQKIAAHVMQVNSHCSWYPLVDQFFPEQQTTEQRLRWFKHSSKEQ